MQEVKVCSEKGLLENNELIGQSQKKMLKYFILLRLNPSELSVDREGWWFDHYVS